MGYQLNLSTVRYNITGQKFDFDVSFISKNDHFLEPLNFI